MKKQENRLKDPSDFFGLMRRNPEKTRMINSKRKISELIIDQLDECSSNESQTTRTPKPGPRSKTQLHQSPIGNLQIDDDIDDNCIQSTSFVRYKNPSRPANRISVDLLLDDAEPHFTHAAKTDNKINPVDLDIDNQPLPTKQLKSRNCTLIDNVLDDLSQTSPIHTKRSKIVYNTQTSSQNDLIIDEWRVDRDRNRSLLQPKYNVDELLNEEPQAPGVKKNNLLFKQHHISPTQSIEIDDFSGKQLATSAKGRSRTATDILLSPPEYRNDRPGKRLDVLPCENLSQPLHERDDEDEESSMRRIKSGVEWLREVNEKLNNVTKLYLNETVCNDDGNRETVPGRKTSPPSMLTMNTSNLFLNENDLKKRKIKYVRNGLAERLQKLLIRQASSINFVKHHMNKSNHATEQTQRFKNISNIIRIIPFYKQSFFNGQFNLIHAFSVRNKMHNAPCSFKDTTDYGNLIYLLIPNEYMDMSKYFDKKSVISTKIELCIYPPWRKMFLKQFDRNVYFCTNLIEIVQLDEQDPEYVSKCEPFKNTIKLLENIQCSACLYTSSVMNECQLTLFNLNVYNKSINQLRAKIELDIEGNMVKSGTYHHHHQPSNYLFYTQNDADYYLTGDVNSTNAQAVSKSQYFRLNSILDALENIGYYGFVTFRAVVQRMGVFNNSENANLPVTQKTQTQISQFQTQSPLKRRLIVSDKCGLFALILLPYKLDAIELIESYKYQFNSLKFIEKQCLNNREDTSLDDELNFLWHEMNQNRQKRSKPTIKTFQRYIYVFEYMRSNRSSIDIHGPSKSYLSLKSYQTLHQAHSDSIESHLTNYYFDLIDVILIRLVDEPLEQKQILYLVDKQTAHTRPDMTISNMGRLEITSTSFLMNNFILDKLNNCFFLFGIKNFDSYESISLKNILYQKSETGLKLVSNAYSSISCTKSSNCTNNQEQEARLMGEFKLKAFLTLTDAIDLSQVKLVQITGQIVRICDDYSRLELSCPNCDKYHARDDCQLVFDSINRLWNCDECGNMTENPNMHVNLQVVVKCPGLGRLVNVKLHQTSISKLIPIKKIKNAFLMDDIELRKDQIFDYLGLVGRQIGPLFCFVDDFSDTSVNTVEIEIFQS